MPPEMPSKILSPPSINLFAFTKARYNFFNAIASKNGIDKVAVAHHKNDLAETMLLNLVRGSGIDGLASMQPKAGNLIRPLLFATRKEIENYAVKSKLAFVEDKTNKDIALSRNLLRRKVIPELEKINPKFIETMAGESNLLRQVADFQEKLAGEAFGKLAKKKGGGSLPDLYTLFGRQGHISKH